MHADRPVFDDSQRFARLMELFGRALEVAAAARETWIARECGDDAALAHELRRMLAADAAAGERSSDGLGVRVLAAGGGSAQEPGAQAGEHSDWAQRVRGDYRIVRRIGEGGMGVVYEAEQAVPRRRVALKVLQGGRSSRRALARFELEAHALGRLHHPCIAQVFEFGLVDVGHGPQACLVMELIDGRPLLAHVVERRLDLRERAALLAKIADAVQHAHGRRVIHRDLKPANILVAADGAPKVLDFGVARLLDDDSARVATLAGQLVGTLAYMSPEQVGGDPDEVGAQADVYALGAIAFELFSGAPLVAVEGRALAQVIADIRERAAPRPSAHAPGVPRDLDAICSKALEKDRARRYASAAEFAADLRRFLADEPVSARAPSMLYVLGKQVRRHRALSAALALLLVALVAFAVQSRRHALASRAEARAANIERGRVLGAFERLAAAESALWAEHERDDDARSRWALMELYARQPCDATLTPASGAFSALAVSADEREICLGSHDGSLLLCDRERIGAREYPRVVEGGVTALAHLGEQGFAVGGGAGELALLERVSGAVRWRREVTPGVPVLLATAREPRAIVASAPRGALQTLALHDGSTLAQWPESGRELRALLVASDGARAYVLDGAEVRAFDSSAATGAPLWSASAPQGAHAALDELSGRLVVATAAGALRVLDAASGVELERRDLGLASVSSLDARAGLLLLGSSTRAALVRLDGREAPAWPTSASGSAYLARLLDGGARAWCAELAGPARLWMLGADDALARHPLLGARRAFGQFAPAHDVFAVFEGSPAVQLRRLSDGALLREVQPSGARLQSLRFDPRGRWCAVGGDDGQVQLAPLDPSAPVVRFASSGAALNALAFDATGERMALTLHGAGVELWRLDPPRLERTLALPTPSTGRLAWSPDGRELAVALRGARVCVLSTASGALQREFDAAASVGVLHWPFDDALFVADLEGGIARVDAASARTAARMLGHEGPVTALALDPTKRWLASSGFDGFVRVWDAVSGVELAHFDPKAGAARGAAFAPDGTRLWAHFADGVARGWKLDALRARVERNRPGRH